MISLVCIFYVSTFYVSKHIVKLFTPRVKIAVERNCYMCLNKRVTVNFKCTKYLLMLDRRIFPQKMHEVEKIQFQFYIVNHKGVNMKSRQSLIPCINHNGHYFLHPAFRFVNAIQKVRRPTSYVVKVPRGRRDKPL